MSYLWEQLHEWFDTYDGCLEDIEINSLSGNEVESTCAHTPKLFLMIFIFGQRQRGKTCGSTLSKTLPA